LNHVERNDGGSGFLPYSLTITATQENTNRRTAGQLQRRRRSHEQLQFRPRKYAAVPVEFNVRRRTHEPVSPKTPHAAGIPAVSAKVLFGVNVKV